MMTWKILRFPVKNADIAKELFVMYNATVRALSTGQSSFLMKEVL